MRIVYVLTTLGIGGAEKQVISLAERMAAKGHVVTILVLKHSVEDEWPVKLPVMRLNMVKTPTSIFRGIRFAKSFLRIFRADILHSHTYPANIFARMLRLSGVRCLLINTIHNEFEGRWYRMLLYRVTNSWTDRITAVSRSVRDKFVGEGIVPAGRTTLVANGIDAQAFAPEKNRRKAARRGMRVQEEFVWIAVGRVVAAKDYPNLLKAFARVLESEPRARLWIAGEGDPAELALESDQASIAGFQPSAAEFLGLRTDIRELLDAADGYVLSSAWEGMPLALGEAMSMEKAVVATDVGGVRELVGGAGLVVAARDSEALGAAMLQVMAMNVRDRAKLGNEARVRIQSLFSMDAKAEEWEQLYLSWLKEQAG